MIFDSIDVNVRKKQGNLGVARAIYEYTKMGYTVLAPFSDSDKYDLVVDTGDQLLKVQVKTSRQNMANGKHTTSGRTGYAVNLATRGGNTKNNTIRNRQHGDYDLLFILLETGQMWSIPSTEIKGTATICVGALGPRAAYTEYEIK